MGHLLLDPQDITIVSGSGGAQGAKQWYGGPELRAELGARHFNLLEKLAEYVATLLLEDFGAQWVRVSVAKLGMMPGVRRVGVVIERSV